MKLTKAASILAFIIGAMAIFAGGQVILLGKEMNYYVINWLPYYNFTMGLITFLVTAILIWKNSRYAMPAAIATFAIHALVMITLLIGYKGVVAPESIKAMTVRLVVWAIILVLMYLDSRAKHPTAA
jgi:hypothetical protein